MRLCRSYGVASFLLLYSSISLAATTSGLTFTLSVSRASRTRRHSEKVDIGTLSAPSFCSRFCKSVFTCFQSEMFKPPPVKNHGLAAAIFLRKSSIVLSLTAVPCFSNNLNISLTACGSHFTPIRPYRSRTTPSTTSSFSDLGGTSTCRASMATVVLLSEGRRD